MKILAIDTALNACSAAIFDAAAERAWQRSQAMERGHAEALMPMIRDLAAEAGFSFPEIDRIAVTTGPGSFTGLRVGVSAARGLALALGKPAIGIGTLEAYAHDFLTGGNLPDGADFLAVALDARKDEIYLQVFNARQDAVVPAHVAAAQQAQLPGGPVIAAGTGAARLAAAFPGHVSLFKGELAPGPAPLSVARLAAQRPLPGHPPSPLYLRPADAKPQARPAFLKEPAR